MPEIVDRARLYEEIEKLQKADRPALIAVDGNIGGGKTSISRELSEKFGIRVFHMDDFYLPMDMRPQGWRHIPAGNMDLTRFEAEVLTTAAHGGAVNYRVFESWEQDYVDRYEPAMNLSIIEGSYCLHPSISDYYTLKVYIEIPSEIQHARIEKREGEHAQDYFDIWIPMEKVYFNAFDIRDKVDYILQNV